MRLDPYNAFLHRDEEAVVSTVPGTVNWRIGVKDVIAVAGMPTTAASKILRPRARGAMPNASRGLARPGATVVGKLNTHEFAFGALTNSPHFGPARNPWDLERTDGRIERWQRCGRRRRARRSCAWHRHGGLGPDPGRASAGSRAIGRRVGLVPNEGVDSRRAGPSTRSGRWPVPPRSAGGRLGDHGPGARCGPAGAGPPHRGRHQAVRGGRLRGRGPRARKPSDRCRGGTSRSSFRCSTRVATITQLVMLPEAGGPRTWAGSAPALPTTERTFAHGCSPGCSCRRPRYVTGPPRPELGPGRSGSAQLGRLRPARRAGDADRRAAIWTRFRPTTGC